MGASAGAGGLGRAEGTWPPPPPPRGGQWAASRSQGAGSATQSPSLPSPRTVVAGVRVGDLVRVAGQRLKLHCPRAAVGAAASLAAAAAPPLGRCRMNGRTGRQALRVPARWPRSLRLPGRAPAPRSPPGPGPPQPEGLGAGVSLGQEAASGEGGGEVTGWGRVSPYALHM